MSLGVAGAGLSDAERAALEALDVEEMVVWARELVRIPSVYRPDLGHTEAQAAEWVLDRLGGLRLETEVQEAAPGRPNVLGWYGQAGGRVLLLEGHTDVVTEGDPAAWRHGPWSGAIEDGRLYGRGSADMKGGLAAALGALAALARSGVGLSGLLLLGALADEEGRMLGVRRFLRSPWRERVSAAVVCEPEDNRLCLAQKGVLWARVVARGRMAHGAMPRTGVNPIRLLTLYLARLQAVEAVAGQRYGGHPLLGDPSFSPTRFHAPPEGPQAAQNNVIPAAAETVLDVRFPPGPPPSFWEERVREEALRLSGQGEGRLEVEILEVRPATETPRQEELVGVMESAWRDLVGREPEFGGVPGSTDGTLLHGAGIPVVVCGPGDTEVPHQVDEWLDLGQLEEAARLYVLTAIRYLGAS